MICVRTVCTAGSFGFFYSESRFRIIYFWRASAAGRKRVSPGLGGVCGANCEIEVCAATSVGRQRSRANSLKFREFLLVSSGKASRPIKIVPLLWGNYLI